MEYTGTEEWLGHLLAVLLVVNCLHIWPYRVLRSTVQNCFNKKTTRNPYSACSGTLYLQALKWACGCAVYWEIAPCILNLRTFQSYNLERNTWECYLGSVVTGNEDSCVLLKARKGPFRCIPTVHEEDKALNIKEKTQLRWGWYHCLSAARKVKLDGFLSARSNIS